MSYYHDLVENFYRASLAADRAALARVVASDAVWTLRLDTTLSGEHVGPDGIASMRRRIDELTAGTWRPPERTASTLQRANGMP